MISQVEYLWIDGATPTQQLRSKTRYIKITNEVSLKTFPEWSYDGSSTFQSSGHNSDLGLVPVNFCKDPTRGDGNYLVMCEVVNADGLPHKSNARAALRKVLDNGGSKAQPWVGFEQEYTLFCEGHPLGWPKRGYPAPQGPFYCGVGTQQVHGRDLVEAHSKACLAADLMLYGINAEVMPAQWEYQIGPRGIDTDKPDPLTVCDHHWMARWLLHRLGEQYGIDVSFSNKPIKGNWNGAGQHANFSTQAMRDPSSGSLTIEKAVTALGSKHNETIVQYGYDLASRLTGSHETCDIATFRSGVADRGASIRIPRHVAEKGYGYIEDRRPGANADPYVVSKVLVSIVCDIAS